MIDVKALQSLTTSRLTLRPLSKFSSLLVSAHRGRHGDTVSITSWSFSSVHSKHADANVMLTYSRCRALRSQLLLSSLPGGGCHGDVKAGLHHEAGLAQVDAVLKVGRDLSQSLKVLLRVLVQVLVHTDWMRTESRREGSEAPHHEEEKSVCVCVC